MIEYVANFLGLDPEYFANSDFAIVLTYLLLVMCVLMLFKALIWWFDKLFG